MNDKSFGAAANLVLRADRSALPRRDLEPSGEAESLWGRATLQRMGDRAFRSKVNLAKLSSKPKDKVLAPKLSTALGSYRPHTSATLQTHSLLLAFISPFVGDVPNEVLVSATDEVISVLKNEKLTDSERKTHVESVIGTIEMHRFAVLVNLGKKITDFATDEVEFTNDDDHAVAVVFDDEDQDSDEFEIKDEIDEDDGIDAGMDTHITAGQQGNDVEMGEDDQDEFTSIINATQRVKPEAKINPKDVDAVFVQRLLSSYYADAITSQSKAKVVFEILESLTYNPRDAENELMALFDYEKFELVKILTVNRDVLVWCTKLAKCRDDLKAREIVEEKIRDLELGWILESFKTGSLAARDTTKEAGDAEDVDMVDVEDAKTKSASMAAPRATVDLAALVFSQGGHTMTNKKCKLPEGSFKRQKKGYEEVHVPAPVPRPMDPNEKLLKISAMPDWTHAAFKSASTLNRIQSRVYPIAFKNDQNMLLCAPTGAGKTNCAMLTMLREIGKNRDPVSGKINLDAFKIVYIAPMKALVAEMVGNFASRLKHYGINVAELTGDRQLTKQQISETQVIVTTPEKWDIITRKSNDRSYTRLVRLVIIDEIHLLHDSRGPVLEAIISRSIRQMQTSQELMRLVGLSATLPNYRDVANFMRVDLETGLFFFDGGFRPCPLKQQYVGLTEKKAIKRLQMMNEIVYEKILEELSVNPENQILVFCHSRKECGKTARAVRDLAIERETIGSFIRRDSGSREILRSEADSNVKNDELKELLPYGFGIHHAGMLRSDRTLIEDLFAGRHVPVLVSTATLAWGVNLPAHTVIIKGTQVYNPEKGCWSELSPQDMLQMLGRAGRPQFDTFGEGIIITTQNELQYYLSLINEQLPIESQMISQLPDIMNAEITMGNIRNRAEAVDWLGYTYLYIRMLRNGGLYGVTLEDAEQDPYLIQKRIDFVHAAANILDKCNLIKYDKKTGRFQGTEIGRIASYYYIGHTSMSTYNQHLKPSMTMIDLLRVFSLSAEFKLVPVRQEEKMELAKMLDRVPVPVKEGMDDPVAKINVLLQSYISQLKLDGFALLADMVYVVQSAGRILRAIFEVCLKRGWSQLSRIALDLCKMVDKRAWLSMNPLRQFPTFPNEIIKKLERKDISWDRYYDLGPQELGELVQLPRQGAMIHKFVHHFPKLELNVSVQPITRSMLKMDLTITADFLFDDKIHNSAEIFWIIVEDADSEHILYHDSFILKAKYITEHHAVSFTVPLFDPLPPNYFVSLISDRWMHAETRVPISFKHLYLPEKYPPHTELLDLQPLPISALRNPKFEVVYAKIEHFNPIQTQVFNTLYSTDENALVCAPSGSGNTVCAEFALLRLWSVNPKARCVFISPMEQTCDIKMLEWKDKFSNLLGGKNIVQLTGESVADLKLLELGDVIFATPPQWDSISRRWKQRKNVATVGLFIADDIHLIGSAGGPTMEVIVSRMRFISVQTENPIRILCLGASLANARDLGEWIGATNNSIFNFHPSVRPVPLEIHIQGYNIPHFPSLMIAMTKPCYNAITTLSAQEPVIVFVPSRKQCRATVFDLLTLALSEGNEKRFLHCSEQDLIPFLTRLEDRSLAGTVEYGVAFYHETLSHSDKKIIEELFKIGAIQVLVSSRESCWGLNIFAHLVVIMGSQYFHGKEHRYVDYPVAEVLHMMGCASRPIEGEVGRCVLMCQAVKKEFYKKFLYEALPVESHLNHFLHDHFNAEIVTKTIENKQDAVDYLTWTFLYRRMAQNPNYYGLEGTSHHHLSDNLSEMVESTLEELSLSKCIVVEEDEVSPLNLGMIAAYYYINYVTIETFSLSLKPKTKLRGLLEIISAASEFDDIPIRHQEESLLRKIYEQLPVKVDTPLFDDPHFKTNILLQTHFSRIQLPADLETDQKSVLKKIVRLLQACVDVISSNGWLSPALATMEISQMCVQAVWDRDSPFKQIPYMTPAIIDKLSAKKCEQVFDIMDLDEKERLQILNLDSKRLASVIQFVNRYPNIEVNYEVSEDAVQGEPSNIAISLEREQDAEYGNAIAPFFPIAKQEGWWLVVGDPKTKTLLAIKRINLQSSLKVNIEFTPEIAGKLDLQLYFMCDCYAGVDQEFEFTMNVSENTEMDMDR